MARPGLAVLPVWDMFLEISAWSLGSSVFEIELQDFLYKHVYSYL